MKKLAVYTGCFFLAAFVRPGISEAPCYRSVSEAAVQKGVLEGNGFRLESIRRDAVQGTSWATLRSCRFPERPALTVPLRGVPGTGLPEATRVIAAANKPVLFAGRRVRMIRQEAEVRLEVDGVAQANGALGDRVKVRLLTSGEERFADGIVLSADLLEMQP